MKKKPTRQCVPGRITALLLSVCICLLLAACGGGKVSQVDVTGERMMVIITDEEEAGTTQVLVRRLVYDEAQKSYHVAEELTAQPGSECGLYGLLLKEEGLYQVECRRAGWETSVFMVNVDENRVYTVMADM